MFGARGQELPDPSTSWVDSLGGLIPKPDIEVGDVQEAGCLEAENFVIPATQTCAASINGPNRGVKEVHLRVTSSSPVNIVAKRPDMLDEERTLQPGESRAFDVYHDGLSLGMTCPVALTGPPCVVALE
jgi:hypothetical protein